MGLKKESKKQAEQKVVFRAEEMAQQGKVPVAKSANLRLVPRPHTMKERANTHNLLFNIHQSMHTCIHMKISKLT